MYWRKNENFYWEDKLIAKKYGVTRQAVQQAAHKVFALLQKNKEFRLIAEEYGYTLPEIDDEVEV